MFDEHGQVVERIPGIASKRRGDVPCDTHLGCPKGHWKEKPDLTSHEALLVDLYTTSKATGGRVLTTGEARDPFILETFAMLAMVDDLVDKRRHEENISTILMVASRSK